VVYIPKDFVPHAASLRHTFVHCGRFVTAAPRRSPGSVSVPMWLAVLSDQLRVVGLVGRYPANYLIRYRPLPERLAALSTARCLAVVSSGITRPFGRLSQAPGHVSDTLLTRPPLTPLRVPVRLACLSHAASVQAEPGSNSSIEFLGTPDPHARCGPSTSSGLTGTDSFSNAIILETSLSTRRGKTPRRVGFVLPTRAG
jgi:hypothetical protein